MTTSSTPTTTTVPATSTPSLQVKLSEERPSTDSSTPTTTAVPARSVPSPEFVESEERTTFRYASYFNRIKQAVAKAWDIEAELRRRHPLGDQYLYKGRSTLLLITLDAHGVLRNVQVARSSGVDFLDRAAIEAFQKAQPFENPPTGLVSASGEIKFTFGFSLEPRQKP